MSERVPRWGLVSLVLLMILGCGKSPAEPEPGDAPSGAPAAATPGRSRIIPILKDQRPLEGNWVVLITVEGRDKYLWIVRISKSTDGQYSGEIVDVSPDEKLEPKIVSTRVDGSLVELKIKNKSAEFDFQGNFDGVAIRGTVGTGEQVMYLARLLSTNETRLADYVNSALPPAADVFQKAIEAMQNKPQPKIILQLARENRNSPVSMEAVYGLLGMQAQGGYDDETLLAVIDQYLDLAKVWGPRVSMQAEFMSARQLVMTGRQPEEALKHLNAAEKLLVKDVSMKNQIQLFREEAQVQISLKKSKSTVEADRVAAFEELLSSLKKQPYNPEILLALARHAAATGQRTVAINYYTELAALPLLEQLIQLRRAGEPPGEPTVSESLKTLWVEEHGNPDGMSEAVAGRLRERLDALKSDLRGKAPAPTPADAGNHRVLVELFTGVQSPPSVAAEIGLDALQSTYPASEVVALRYHQHIPAPDGLVNQDSEDRFAAYELGQTPTLVIDGAPLDSNRLPYTGYMQASSNAYVVLRSFVDPRLKKSTPVELDLGAKIENGELSLRAEVRGASEEELPGLRLRLALAEETVHSHAPIGLRVHSMIVREMPGGARGILPKKGELKYSFTMPFAELQKHLDDYLSRYEAGNRLEIPAEAKPPIRGRLFLVGWVQNDKLDPEHPEVGRPVVQVNLVPVEGDIPAPAGSTPPSDAPPGKTPAAPTTPVTDEAKQPPAPALPED